MTFSQYGPSTMLQLLNSTFEATSDFRIIEGLKIPYFYNHKDVIIFPPVSDEDNSSNHLESIFASLNTTVCDIKDNGFNGKKLIFPVVQEQSFFGYRRNHWVTLYYDPHTEIATVIDSRPMFASYWYVTGPIQTSLANGLKLLGHNIKRFQVKYQGIQDDYVRCGAWTATNIELLAHGKSVDNLLRELKSEHRDAMVRHQQYKIEQGKNPVVFNLNPVLEATSSHSFNDSCHDSTDVSKFKIESSHSELTRSSNEETSDPNEPCLDDYVFPEEKKQREAEWLETANQLITATMSHPNLIAHELITQQDIIHHVNPDLLKHLAAKDLFALIDACSQTNDSDLTIRSDLGSFLRMIGIEEQAIITLSLSELLIFDAVIRLTVLCAGNERFYANCLSTIDSSQFMEIIDEHRDFKSRLFASLKQVIETRLRIKFCDSARSSCDVTKKENTDSNESRLTFFFTTNKPQAKGRENDATIDSSLDDCAKVF